MSKPKLNSLNIKIALSFIVLGLFLLTILFVLIVPTMQTEQKNYRTNQIEHMILLTTQQLKLAVKFLINHGEDKIQETKSLITYEVDKVKYNIENSKDMNHIQDYLNRGAKNIQCDIFLLDKDKRVILKTSQNKMLDKSKKSLKHAQWLFIKSDRKYSVCPSSSKELFYTSNMNGNDNSLVVSCNPNNFYHASVSFEDKIKKDIQKSFELTQSIHKGKIYLMWIDVQNAQKNDKPLYTSGDSYFNQKYCISKISNISSPSTGLLTGKQILDAADKAPILHFIDSDEDEDNFIYPALTWVSSLNNDPKRKLLFITTVNVSDFDNKLDSSFWKILPAAIFALLLAIVAGFFLFRRLFKSIDVLSQTARLICDGKVNIRSHIKGDDDIGVLGVAFDSMLNKMEDNIKNLDLKVELRTQELSNSLKEKEILLQEIHHRVKNNLALTINLIKLQKSKVSDENTRNVLEEIKERVFTMELLHRKLYESKNLDSIPLKKYIQDLVLDISNTYNKDKDITINLNIDEVYVNIEYALPCGLIINECVTNAFKYAFGNKKGQLSIKFKKTENNCVLVIQDDGVGLSKGLDINKSKTLGLRLISSITKGQLLGKIDYVYDNGAKFIIVFEIEK